MVSCTRSILFDIRMCIFLRRRHKNCNCKLIMWSGSRKQTHLPKNWHHLKFSRNMRRSPKPSCVCFLCKGATHGHRVHLPGSRPTTVFESVWKMRCPKRRRGSFIWKSLGFCINVHGYVWKKWLSQPSNMVFTEIFKQRFDEQLSCVDVFWSILQRRALLARHTSILPAPYIAPSAPFGLLLQAWIRFDFYFGSYNGLALKSWFWMDFHRINRRKVWMETYWHIETRIIHPYWPYFPGACFHRITNWRMARSLGGRRSHRTLV